MPTLCSTKELVGPALDMPHVTFHAWYVSRYGIQGWKKLRKIPRMMWMEYLNWFRDVLALPTPVEALERVKGYPNFSVRLKFESNAITWKKDEIHIGSAKEELVYDFLILATGYAIDGAKQSELAPFFDQILLWNDLMSIKNMTGPRWLYNSPYLGPHFQFLEKTQNSAPFLQDIYCFNYAATLSHGLLSGDIPGIGTGAWRLARGIASDLFNEGYEDYYEQLKVYQKPEFIHSQYEFFQH